MKFSAEEVISQALALATVNYSNTEHRNRRDSLSAELLNMIEARVGFARTVLDEQRAEGVWGEGGKRVGRGGGSPPPGGGGGEAKS